MERRSIRQQIKHSTEICFRIAVMSSNTLQVIMYSCRTNETPLVPLYSCHTINSICFLSFCFLIQHAIPITVTACRYVLLHGKCRLHSAGGVKGVKLSVNVNLMCGRWKCAYLGCIADVSNIPTANQDLHGYGKARDQKGAFVLKWVMEFTSGRTADVSEIFIYSLCDYRLSFIRNQLKIPHATKR